MSGKSGSSAATLGNFFAGDDWYTDADSNAYSLPTFLGNHDMGRIGKFLSRTGDVRQQPCSSGTSSHTR